MPPGMGYTPSHSPVSSATIPDMSASIKPSAVAANSADPSPIHLSVLKFTGKNKHRGDSISKLMILAVILCVLWMVGFATELTINGLVHILPVLVALIVFHRLYQTRQIRRGRSLCLANIVHISKPTRKVPSLC